MTHNYNDLSDDELLLLHRKGDRKAFTTIHNHYWPDLLVHANKMLRDEDLAKGVVQDLLTHLFQHIENIHINKSLAAYLHVSITHRVLNLIKRRKVLKIDYLESIAGYEITDTHETDENLILKELIQVIDQEIERMPAEMKRVFKLSYKENRTNQEIAEELNIAPSTVSTHMSRAIRKLKNNPDINHHFNLMLLVTLQVMDKPELLSHPIKNILN